VIFGCNKNPAIWQQALSRNNPLEKIFYFTKKNFEKTKRKKKNYKKKWGCFKKKKKKKKTRREKVQLGCLEIEGKRMGYCGSV